MAKTKFEWDYQAAGDLMLRSAEIADICLSEAERMTRATGVEYTPMITQRGSRYVATAAKGDSSSEDEEGYYSSSKNGKVSWVRRNT